MGLLVSVSGLTLLTVRLGRGWRRHDTLLVLGLMLPDVARHEDEEGLLVFHKEHELWVS